METNKKIIYAVVAFLGILILAMAISQVAKQESDVITVSAAASLTEAFTDIASHFEEENPGTNVSLNFGGSGNLRMQIEGGAPVDVFASADESQMNILGNETLIDNSSRKDFAQNSLVLIVPETSTLNITGLKDLADPKIEKISICNPDTAPCRKICTSRTDRSRPVEPAGKEAGTCRRRQTGPCIRGKGRSRCGFCIYDRCKNCTTRHYKNSYKCVC